MKPEFLMARLLAVHEEYLNRGPKGPEARVAIEREFANLQSLALVAMYEGLQPFATGAERKALIAAGRRSPTPNLLEQGQEAVMRWAGLR